MLIRKQIETSNRVYAIGLLQFIKISRVKVKKNMIDSLKTNFLLIGHHLTVIDSSH